eukprot:SRR837773.20956.p1 GENE.SRR837773.20956~~SRR837773.20956.p1  ORF type:complete len:152 (-),score=75.19 SRR837773.20956:43-471(-)
MEDTMQQFFGGERLGQCLYFVEVYAGLVFMGGLMGFCKAKSKASLIASTIVAAVLIGLDYVTRSVNEVYGFVGLSLFSLVLLNMFLGKYKKSGQPQGGEPLMGGAAPSKKFMPFGLLFWFSIIAFIWTSASAGVVMLNQRKH